MIRRRLLVVLALAAIAIAGHAVAQGTVVHEQTSPYGQIFVVDSKGERFLRFGSPDGDDQSGLDLRDPGRPVLEYIPLTLAGLATADKLERGLVVGFGAGMVTRYWHLAAPEMFIDSVEICPVVTALAFTHFGFQPAENLPIHVMDGRRFVQDSAAQYDVVLLDAYGSGDAPYHLTTLEFYQEVRARLAPGGVVMANMVAEAEATVAAMMRTFDEAFDEVVLLATAHDGNVVLLGYGEGRSSTFAADVEAFVQEHPLQGHGTIGDPIPLPEGVATAPVLRDAAQESCACP
jgi:spermidine synthase